MSKKFTRLMAILLSLNLTFSTGTFAAFAAEAEDGSTDTVTPRAAIPQHPLRKQRTAVQKTHRT